MKFALKTASTGKYINGLYFKGRTGYSSIFGGIATLFYMAMIISFSTFALRETFDKVNWNIDDEHNITNLTEHKNEFNIHHIVEVVDFEFNALTEEPMRCHEAYDKVYMIS